jgi:hypothetical protein
MKLKDTILTLTALVLLASTRPVTAQSDSSGNKHFAYAHLYSEDTYTEYISSVFCWTQNPSNTSPEYPSDSLTKWAKSIFKNHLPDVKVRRCICKFVRTNGDYYTAEQATKSWKMEITESQGQNVNAVIVSFPDCIGK